MRMRKNLTVLGCGMIGATIARDLAADESLQATVVDVSDANLLRVAGVPRLQSRRADLSTPSGVSNAIAGADVVVGAMPSALGLMVLKTVIEAGKPFADISFMAEDARQLDELARKNNVTAVVDCGVAPGLANLLIGMAAAKMTQVDRAVYYVGGLPHARDWPYQYKAPFAPLDVIEEYTRPARMIENGRVVTKEALSEPELLAFEPVGELEAFNTDGLRSLLTTIPARDMKEKTLRWPGHVELMRVLRDTGYFDKDEIELRGGQRVRPIDVTSRLLFGKWELRPGEPEFTVLRVIVEGSAAEGGVRMTADLFDETDARTGTSSMARTTGFPCAIVTRMLAAGRIAQRGVLPPELLAKEPGVADEILHGLAQRGVVIRQRNERL